ncbi:unnamed protein product [Adineta ricciae]|uniref:Ras-GEF domain-containing protein n=1 Tax=Adineta ricciae TaxID=249248 RepID=A0A814KCX7_ADIRI|nr:unnamed protein product [Adineta ricciae]CAF1050948.1 unnamed protein product [Adineta ricciae]
MFPIKFESDTSSESLNNIQIDYDADDIRKYQPVDIATQLTLFNRHFLLLIQPEELINFAFLSTEKKTLAPNLTIIFAFYDRTVRLFATQILKHQLLEQRASIIKHLVLVIQQLFTVNHDLQSIRLILATFDHPSIFRLRQTWRIFRRENPNLYITLKYFWNVLSQGNNWSDYRLWIEEKFIKDCLSKKQPMVLFVGYLLSKMISDHYRYYRIYSNDSSNEKSSRVHQNLIEYVKLSSPTEKFLSEK